MGIVDEVGGKEADGGKPLECFQQGPVHMAGASVMSSSSSIMYGSFVSWNAAAYAL